jgi:hypothetical protein
MIRKFNYTGRKKIKRDRISISLVEDKPYKSFTAAFKLKGLGLADDAVIYIEPYYKSSFMRFSFGTVAKVIPPENTYLTDIPSTNVLQFRVKVVDESGENGKIIAYADNLTPHKPEANSSRNSILPIDWDHDLNQQLYRVSFRANGPILEINQRLANRKELMKKDNVFRSLVLPSVLKEICQKIVATNELFDREDDSWQNQWLKYINEVLHVDTAEDLGSPEMNDDDISEWLDEVVAAFCNYNKIRSKFEQAKPIEK